jgi:hypothetical protein
LTQRLSGFRFDRQPDKTDISDAVTIARLRLMITRSEARKARRDFADAIRRIESSAAHALGKTAL